jgi:hypothetical protein
MDGQISLDNKTIVKLAYAIATAVELGKRGGAIGPTGPTVRKLIEAIDGVEALPHFMDHKN